MAVYFESDPKLLFGGIALIDGSSNPGGPFSVEMGELTTAKLTVKNQHNTTVKHRLGCYARMPF
jgi:hypothetical protein